MDIKAEMRMMGLQAKGCQRSLENHQKLGERHGDLTCKEDLLAVANRRDLPCQYPAFRLLASRMAIISLCCLSHPV